MFETGGAIAGIALSLVLLLMLKINEKDNIRDAKKAKHKTN